MTAMTEMTEMTIFIVDELKNNKKYIKITKKVVKQRQQSGWGEDSCETGEIAFGIPSDRLIALNTFYFLYFSKKKLSIYKIFQY